jgi:hypothetical protein
MIPGIASQGGHAVGTVQLPASIHPVDDQPPGNPATASLSLQADGDVLATNLSIADWLAPVIDPGAYEARMTLTSGAFDTGTVDAWLSLASDQSWSETANNGTESASGTLEIRRASDGVVLASCSVTLEVLHSG